MISAAADHGFSQRAAYAALPTMLCSAAAGMKHVAASQLDGINQQETEQLLGGPAGEGAQYFITVSLFLCYVLMRGL
jgi:hypothetical protein